MARYVTRKDSDESKAETLHRRQVRASKYAPTNLYAA